MQALISTTEGVKALARQDAARGLSCALRYAKMCNHGEEHLADIYADEYRRVFSAATVRVGTILMFKGA